MAAPTSGTITAATALHHYRGLNSSMLTDLEPPTALISLNSAMTIGSLRAIQEAGLSIPSGIAFAAYDDFEWSDLFQPGLTAIAQDVARMGREAVDLLINRIRGQGGPFVERVIDTTFHRRTSCGCEPLARGTDPA